MASRSLGVVIFLRSTVGSVDRPGLGGAVGFLRGLGPGWGAVGSLWRAAAQACRLSGRLFGSSWLPPSSAPLTALRLPVLPHGSPGSAPPQEWGAQRHPGFLLPACPLAPLNEAAPLPPGGLDAEVTGHQSPSFILFSGTHEDLLSARWGLGAGTHREHSLWPGDSCLCRHSFSQ